ncbi:hypothetical protein NMD1_02006 [Novosphingobium sp. MD-1]|nr:hypothetical protein NMD1_02006 [Novosphingobium sp. MD-1]
MVLHRIGILLRAESSGTPLRSTLSDRLNCAMADDQNPNAERFS